MPAVTSLVFAVVIVVSAGVVVRRARTRVVAGVHPFAPVLLLAVAVAAAGDVGPVGLAWWVAYVAGPGVGIAVGLVPGLRTRVWLDPAGRALRRGTVAGSVLLTGLVVVCGTSAFTAGAGEAVLGRALAVLVATAAADAVLVHRRAERLRARVQEIELTD